MRIKDGRAVPAFISQALLNEAVKVFGRRPADSQLLLLTDWSDGIIKLMCRRKPPDQTSVISRR